MKTITRTLPIAGRERTITWDELDGLRIEGLNEIEMEAVVITLGQLRAHHVDALRDRERASSR